MTGWKCIIIAGRKGGNHVLAVSSGLMKSDRWYTSISILSLKFLKVELVRVFLASNLGQHFLVVVITQCPTKLLVGHVSSAIPLSPELCRLFRAYDSELPVHPLPRHNWREPRIGQHVESELDQLGPGFRYFVQWICERKRDQFFNWLFYYALNWDQDLLSLNNYLISLFPLIHAYLTQEI